MCAWAVCPQAGFKRTDGENFNALWCSPLKSEEYRAIRKFQRVRLRVGTAYPAWAPAWAHGTLNPNASSLSFCFSAAGERRR